MALKKVDEIDLKPYLNLQMVDARYVGKRLCICYKNIPLWFSDGDMEDLKIFVCAPENKKEGYCLMCQNKYDDCFTYGNWKTLDEVKAYLENPTELY